MARRDEIEEAVLTRIHAVSDPSGVGDHIYAEGLRDTVGAAIDFALAAIRSPEKSPPPIPAALLVQARMAARNGIGLDTVLRRYFAGYVLLGDFVIEEAQERIDGAALKRLLRLQATLFDAVIAAVSEEHRRDEPHRRKSGDLHRIELVQRLLDGELLNSAELAYDFETTHLGLVAQGANGMELVEGLARALGGRLLLVVPEGQTIWAWLGSIRAFSDEEVWSLLGSTAHKEVLLAVGEPGEGLAGWRLSHRQARAALPIALLGPDSFVRYGNVALLSSLLQDDLLATSLRRLYLDPLSAERDGGAVMRSTLRAYLASGRNVSSAAAALKVKRHTVANRIRVAEERIGKPLEGCMAELDAVLRLEDLRAFDRAGSGGALSIGA